MIVLKIVSAVFCVSCGAYLGLKKAARAREKVKVLQQIERLIARIQGEIFYRGTELDELLRQLQKEDFCPGICLEECTQLRNYVLPDVLDKGEKEQLNGFFQQLGNTTALESEKQGLFYEKICAQLIEKAQAQTYTAENLYLKLGLCAGSIVAIMLF